MGSFAALIPAVLGILMILTFLVAAIIAHRAKSFWGTWMMLLGSSGSMIGMSGVGVANFLLFQSISSSIAAPSSPPSSLAMYSLISGICSLLSFAGILAFVVGLLALAIRYGAYAKRIGELETITGSLMEKQNVEGH